MKTFIIKTLLLISILGSQLSINAQNCADTFFAGSKIASATEIITSLTGNACVYNSRSECYNASQLLAQAAKDILDAFNSQTPNGCIECGLSSLMDLASTVNNLQRQLYAMGYPLYTSGAGALDFLKGWDYPEFLCRNMAPRFDTPDLTGNWCSDNGSKVDITFDRYTSTYTFRMYSDKYPNEYVTTARYTGDFEVLAETWGATAAVYDGALVFSDQTWEKDCPSSGGGSASSGPGFYLVQISGSGWRKAYGGAHKITGHHYQIYQVKEGTTINEVIAKHKQELLKSSEKYCKSGPPSCPCSSLPYIWTSGPSFSILEKGESMSKLYNDPANQCEDRSYPTWQPCRAYTSTWVKAKDLSGLCF